MKEQNIISIIQEESKKIANEFMECYNTFGANDKKTQLLYIKHCTMVDLCTKLGII